MQATCCSRFTLKVTSDDATRPCKPCPGLPHPAADGAPDRGIRCCSRLRAAPRTRSGFRASAKLALYARADELAAVDRSRCRCMACHSPSRTTSILPACRQLPPCPAFAYEPQRSATVVQKLLDAGAIAIGKTNLDQFATGLVGTRSPYGICRNSFDEDYISGGSSSGSAVALALGQVSFALGTDTAGSGRIPAAFNNLIGYKPTLGLLSTHGMLPACRSLDAISIFALTANDAAAVAQVGAGFDAADPWSRPAQLAGKRGWSRAGSLPLWRAAARAARVLRQCAIRQSVRSQRAPLQRPGRHRGGSGYRTAAAGGAAAV